MTAQGRSIDTSAADRAASLSAAGSRSYLTDFTEAASSSSPLGSPTTRPLSAAPSLDGAEAAASGTLGQDAATHTGGNASAPGAVPVSGSKQRAAVVQAFADISLSQLRLNVNSTAGVVDLAEASMQQGAVRRRLDSQHRQSVAASSSVAPSGDASQPGHAASQPQLDEVVGVYLEISAVQQHQAAVSLRWRRGPGGASSQQTSLSVGMVYTALSPNVIRDIVAFTAAAKGTPSANKATSSNPDTSTNGSADQPSGASAGGPSAVDTPVNAHHSAQPDQLVDFASLGSLDVKICSIQV